jgi:hypothetical protein
MARKIARKNVSEQVARPPEVAPAGALVAEDDDPGTATKATKALRRRRTPSRAGQGRTRQ